MPNNVPIVPWEICTFPNSLVVELDRRKKNRSFNYVDAARGNWDSDSGDWSNYRGVMSPWVRFCSNGQGREFESKPDKNGNPVKIKNPMPGFVFFSGKDFYSGYGFRSSASSSFESIIGYTPEENPRPHIINNDLSSNYPIHVPPPEIEKVSITIQKELFRRATVEWVCFSKAQLEYMTPYFMVPHISCVLEWGWNHYDPSSLLNLSNTTLLKKLHNNPYKLYTDHILKSRGNYDVFVGIVSGFEWSVDGNKIKCKTEMTSPDRIYAGLALDSSAVQAPTDDDDKNGESKVAEQPFQKIKTFVENVLPNIKSIAKYDASTLTSLISKGNNQPSDISNLLDFIKYVQYWYPDDKWREYIYGIFYGRDSEDKDQLSSSGKTKYTYDNKEDDFDRKSPGAETWINLGLMMEIINYHSAPLTGLNSKEMFRVEIDDVVIGGHPNLISMDGSVLLIPNAESPKYFYGHWVDTTEGYDPVDYAPMKNSSVPSIKLMRDWEDAKKQHRLADYRLGKICFQSDAIYRDDLDELINDKRHKNCKNPRNFAFPFVVNVPPSPPLSSKTTKTYPARYSGYLKDLYINIKVVKEILNNTEIKTYPELITKIMEQVNSAAGNFWDFRLIGTTGREGLTPPKNSNFSEDDVAFMKIADYRFIPTVNNCKIYTFDYMDADSLLLGLDFRPTLSNAQAIRTMFANTNNPDKKVTLADTNELLTYHFRDRLFLEDDKKGKKNVTMDVNKTSHSPPYETWRPLQQKKPADGSFQMSTYLITPNKPDTICIRRLVLPNGDALKMLLDDSDTENNPQYTGIMPNIQCSFTVQGIGGLRTFMAFLVRNLPEPYSENNIVFRIINLEESIDNKQWITTITAGILPLTDLVKSRLGIETQ